jgi:hypothetical protein
MNDLTKELNKLIQTCQDMTDVLKRATILIRAIALLVDTFHQKKCEDGYSIILIVQMIIN